MTIRLSGLMLGTFFIYLAGILSLDASPIWANILLNLLLDALLIMFAVTFLTNASETKGGSE